MKDYPGRTRALEAVLVKQQPIVYRYEVNPDYPDGLPCPGLRITVFPSGSCDIFRVSVNHQQTKQRGGKK